MTRIWHSVINGKHWISSLKNDPVSVYITYHVDDGFDGLGADGIPVTLSIVKFLH